MKSLKNCPLLLNLSIVAIFLISCEKDDYNKSVLIPDGFYSGSFIYSGDTLWEAIIFNADTFKEAPSGGLQMGEQKFPCIVEGLYSIKNENINFNVYKYPPFDKYPPPYELCDSDIYLCGDYKLKISGEEISFWKGEGVLRQTYKLKLYGACH
jgi:hypothetical protein